MPQNYPSSESWESESTRFKAKQAAKAKEQAAAAAHYEANRPATVGDAVRAVRDLFSNQSNQQRSSQTGKR